MTKIWNLVSTHHPVLGVNCREGAWLSNVGRVTKHGWVARWPGVFWEKWRHIRRNEKPGVSLSHKSKRRVNKFFSSDIMLKHTLHIKRARVDSSWLSIGVSSIISGVVISRCGGIHLNRHANREQLKCDVPPSKKGFNVFIFMII